MKIEIAVLAPVAGLAVLVVADTTEVADDNRPDASLDTLRNDMFREGMDEVDSAFGTFPVQPKVLVRSAIVTLRLLPPEVVFVLFQCVTGEEDRLAPERKCGDV